MKIRSLKNILTFIFWFPVLFPVHLPAQSVKWSAPLNDDKKMQYMKIIGTDDDGFYVLRSNLSLADSRDHSGFRNRRYALQYFDLDMNLKWYQQLAASVPEAKITTVQMFNSKVLIVSSLVGKKNKKYSLFAQYINHKGVYEDEPVLLDSLSVEKINDDSKPDVVVSHDQSKAVCAFRKISVSNKEEQEYEAIVMDTCLAIVYRKNIAVPLNAKHFNPLDFVLTDEGNFFLLGMRYVTEKKVKAPNESFYQLYSYHHDHDAVTSSDVRMDDKFLTDAGIAADNLNKKVVVAGFYSDKTTYSTAGVFYYSVNEDSVFQSAMKSSPFSSSFLSKFLGERKENNNRELMNYSIDRLILRKDGGAAIVAESYYETSSSYWDYYTQTYISHRYYHFGNVIVLSVNPDGSILFGNSVSKDQNSTDDAGYSSSYSSCVAGGKIFCIYNKYVEQESSVLITSIDGTGKQNTDVLFNEVKNISVVARSAKQIDSETLLLPAYRENNFHIVKIEF
ncbi:MAG: hypothetical protein NT126_04955 [Bacteroidetes bacterium]|nr:hypothetical protein [Bacteroidota bacterium]